MHIVIYHHGHVYDYCVAEFRLYLGLWRVPLCWPNAAFKGNWAPGHPRPVEFDATHPPAAASSSKP